MNLEDRASRNMAHTKHYRQPWPFFIFRICPLISFSSQPCVYVLLVYTELHMVNVQLQIRIMFPTHPTCHVFMLSSFPIPGWFYVFF